MPEQATERTTAWIDKELVRMAKSVAGIEGKGKTAGEIIDEELEGPLTRRYRKAIGREHAELGEAGA